MQQKLIRFITHELWLIHDHKLRPLEAAMVKGLKVAVLSAQGFTKDDCPLRASALTLYSVLSIVPVIAMLFGIAKGFGFETTLAERLIDQLPQQDGLVIQLITFAQNLLESTKGSVVAGIGIIVLFWTVISLIGNIEESFNHIWKIPKGRSLSRKFSDYLSLMLLAPIILIVASSISVILRTQLNWLMYTMGLPEVGAEAVLDVLGMLPLLLMIGLFAFVFLFMPNHQVQMRAGISAGIVTGLLYYLIQWIYLTLQIGASSYNAIYGSFAAIPLFVIWLQAAWMAVLFGCEIAFYLQNYENYRNNSRFANISFSLQKIIALQVSHLVIKEFTQMKAPLSADAIASRLVIPIAVIRPILQKLTASRIVVEFKPQEGEDEVYQPAVDPGVLTTAYVINALEQCGQNELPDINQERVFADVVNDFRNLMERSVQNRLLKNL